MAGASTPFLHLLLMTLQEEWVHHRRLTPNANVQVSVVCHCTYEKQS